MPYVTSIADGKTLSAIPAFNVASRNFIVANYGADGGCLDNDDGSSWYRIEDNFCVCESARGAARVAPHCARVPPRSRLCASIWLGARLTRFPSLFPPARRRRA